MLLVPARWRRCGAALALAGAAAAAQAAGYRVTLIDDNTPDPGYINDAGDVVGSTWVNGNSIQAFVVREGRKTLLDNLGGAWGTAYGIGPAGEVLGWSTDAQGTTRAVLWRSPTPTPLRVRGVYSAVVGANLGGAHVGSTWIHQVQHAIRWSRQGRPTDLGSLGGTQAYAAAVNREGIVVGAAALPDGTLHAFRHDGTALQDLGTLVAGRASRATAINRHGETVGIADVSDTGQRAVRFTAGRVEDLGTLGGDQARAWAINDRGEIVGESTIGDLQHPWRTRAFLVRHGVMHNLQALLLPEEQGRWHLTVATSINNSGQIVARARPPGTGYYDAVLVRLDPVD